jgi:glycine/D-amino acid oxidase-like deaminating enzyme
MSGPWPQAPPTAADRARYAEAVPASFWTEALPARAELPALEGAEEADLCIVGGGFTGLWAALAAKAEDPDRDVVLVEADRVGAAASGRNGGFVDSSLTHGIANGLARFATEMETLERLGRENFDGLRADLERHGIECGFEQPGTLDVALEPHELGWLEEEAELLRRFGREAELLDAGAARAEVASPTYLGALWSRGHEALVDPGRLGAGLLAAVVEAGVRVHERSAASALRERGAGVEVSLERGTVGARGVLLATSAFPPLVRAIRRYVAPVYDYVLLSEPIPAELREQVGWRRRQGISDLGNQFHYYRLTPEDRVLYGGYDAVYRYGGPVRAALDDHDATFAKLSQHFATTFPQLAGLRFTHRWGGAIDTCARFSVFFGTSHRGRVAYAVGYTGLGVAATRFGARVALDLLAGRETEATRLRYVRSKPFPFPPEPLRSAVIQLTRNRLAAADRRGGRRGLWLRTLDRLGLGFDS